MTNGGQQPNNCNNNNEIANLISINNAVVISHNNHQQDVNNNEPTRTIRDEIVVDSNSTNVVVPVPVVPNDLNELEPSFFATDPFESI